MMITEYREIRNAVLELINLSDVQKIMLVDDLSEFLEDKKTVILNGYDSRAGEPDLRVVADRAEWFIDQLVLLPREPRNSGRSVKERINTWKSTVESRHILRPQQLEMLRTKYAGRIRTGIIGAKAFESIETFEKFIEEWFPYGKSLQEMEEILGIQLRVENGAAVVTIDSGYAGMHYQFIHDKGTIRVLKRTGIN